jgi:FixJ family two-component response regulator
MSTPAPVVFVVDDDVAFLKAASRLLRAGGYSVQTFASADDFLKTTRPSQPSCIILDLNMPRRSGLDLQAALASARDTIPIIFLTGQGDIPSSVHAIKQGAEDFLTKPVKKGILFSAVERALARYAKERECFDRKSALRALFDTLTPREHEVLDHVLTGQLNKQIASDLGTSERTIKAHRANVMSKLQVRSIAELVRLAQESGR